MKIPNFSEFSKYDRQPRRMNEANDDQFFKTYEETEAWLIEMGVKRYIINPSTLVVDVKGSVDISYTELPHGIPVQFGNASLHFDCMTCELSTLNGCPRLVGRNFSCDNNKLVNLMGGPQEVKNYSCGHNLLTSLEGAPRKVGNTFSCKENNSLTPETMDYPMKVGGSMYHSAEIKFTNADMENLHVSRSIFKMRLNYSHY